MKTTRFAIMVLGIYAPLALAQQPSPTPRTQPALQGATSGVTCNDITKLDIHNLTIHAAQRTFAFHDGIAESGPLEQVPTGGKTELRHEWEAQIEKDTIVRPTSDAVVRFLLIHNSHETGSGWRNYLIGFHCSGGKLEQVFLRDGMSLTVDRLDASGVAVGLTENPGDSTRKTWLYTWDGHRYVVSSTQ